MTMYGLTSWEFEEWKRRAENDEILQKIETYLKAALDDNCKYEESFSILRPWLKMVQGAVTEMQADIQRALELRGET